MCHGDIFLSKARRSSNHCWDLKYHLLCVAKFFFNYITKYRKIGPIFQFTVANSSSAPQICPDHGGIVRDLLGRVVRALSEKDQSNDSSIEILLRTLPVAFRLLVIMGTIDLLLELESSSL